MSCSPHNIQLDPHFSATEWEGLTWSLYEVPTDNTFFEGTLTRAIFVFKDNAGNVDLTLDSDIVGEVTLNATTANAWSVTVKDLKLTLDPGIYSWALITYDDSKTPAREKVVIAGTIKINKDPKT